MLKKALEFSALFPDKWDILFQHQEKAMINSPEQKIKGGTMPDTCTHKNDHFIDHCTEFPSAVSP